MSDDYYDILHDSESNAPYQYADSFVRYELQLPLGVPWPIVTGSLISNDLYNDNQDNWLYYGAGTHKTAIAANLSERLGGITITVVSGATNVYVQLSEYFADENPVFISAPYTVSGDSGGEDLLLASYAADTPENPQNYWIALPSPGTYKISFPSPVAATAVIVTHSGSSPYALSQILPRKVVQAFDLEVGSIKAYHVSATLIDTIALQVADSIVVGPELIGLKSIDGSKIVDGTISGVLIRDGTVTGNKVLAGTISGVLLQGSTITGDKIVANTISGSLIAANTITANKIAVGTITFNEIASNTLTAGQLADGAVTGRKILDGTISGVLIQDDAISASKIQANSITAAKIAAGTITGDKITAGTISGELITARSITSNQIAVSGITADNISARVITAEKIVLSGITAELLGAEAVTAAALASGAVISGKIAANSIYASNIVGGQITGYHVAANTITGDRLNVNQLDAVAANMGNLIVNSGISVAAGGYITVPSGYIEAGKARLDSTGLQIGNVASSNLPSITDTLRIAGSGGGGNIVGMAFYNGAFSATVPQALVQLDGTTALEIENNAPESAVINLNFPANGLSQSATVNVYNGNLSLRNTSIAPADITPGALRGLDRNNTIRYYLGADQFFLNNGSSNTFVVTSSNGSITTSGTLYVGGPTNTNDNIEVNGSVITEFAVKAKSELNAGFDGLSAYRFNVQTNGNTAIAGTLGVTSTTTLNGNFLQYNYGGMYKNTAQTIAAGADARITFQVAYINGILDNLANNRLTIANAGMYIITAGVVSATVGSTFQVVTGGAFGSGAVISNVIQTDMRAYTTKPVYLGSGTNLELWVRNSGGTTISVNTGTNGTILTAAKVG